jgi:hypothetical protein
METNQEEDIQIPIPPPLIDDSSKNNESISLDALVYI